MSIARYDHTASLLTKGPNAGKVLVVGGYGSSSSAISLNALETVELYDPATDKWSQAAKLLIGIGDTTAGRGDHTSVVLNDGRVLVVGGTDLNSASLISTEIYDPVYDTWSFSGSQISGRSYNTITLFPNGKVMVAGGESDAGGTTNTAEIYDPTTPIPSVPAVLDSQGNTVTAAIPSLTGGWTSVASMAKARNAPTATLLPNGKLLMAGGFNDKEFVLKSSELYDPVTDTWSATGNMIDARFQHTALLLTTGPNAGKVLVVGGYGVGILPLASAELYDPSTGLWSSTGSMSVARTIHSAVMLPNGKVLVMGGLDLLGTQLNSTELYDPVSGIWTTTNNFTYARDNFTVTLLPADTLHPNGSVLATGGYGATSVLNSSELYWW
jgi:N-acetylneuraminic acid mutarotase